MAGKVWKEGQRRGIAYVEDREAAEKVKAFAAKRSGGGKRKVAGSAAAAQAAEVAKKRGRGVPKISAQEAALQDNGAMAVYFDKKGRPFAYQIPFDLACWEQVAKMIGADM